MSKVTNTNPPEETRFRPGQSGNPAGRPPGIPNAKTRYKRLLELTSKKANPVTGDLEEFTQLELMDMAVFNKALKGDLRAYQEIMDRLEGKPQQSVDMSVAVNPIERILDKYGIENGGDNARQTSEAS